MCTIKGRGDCNEGHLGALTKGGQPTSLPTFPNVSVSP